MLQVPLNDHILMQFVIFVYSSFSSFEYLRCQKNAEKLDSAFYWIKFQNIFSYQLLLFPIFTGNPKGGHWSLVIVYIDTKQIMFYDSLARDGTTVCHKILRLLELVHMDEKKIKLPGAWTITMATGLVRMTK